MTATGGATDDLSVVEPIASDATFGGKAIKVVPLKVGQLPKFSRALKGMVGINFDALLDSDMEAMFGLIADHGENIIEAISVATGIAKADLEAAEIDEVVLLAVTVMKVNADFFARRLMPAVRRALDQA